MVTPEKTRQKYTDAQIRRRKLRVTRTKKLFIEGAQKLIQEDGIANLSIRKLSDLTGYGSATLYSYFTDLDELILFASIKYRREYLLELSQVIKPEMSILAQYRKLYEVFNVYSFSSPELFMNMYFGSHAHRIEEYFEEYYELYPEEETDLPEFLYSALKERDLFRCDKIFARRLAEEGAILPEHSDLVSELLVRLQQTFLYDFTIRPDTNIQEQNQRFLRMFDHIISLSAPSGGSTQG